MLATSVIARKRDGKKLDRDAIRFLIDGFTRGKVTDYQMSAFAMAVCIQGMDAEETAVLTQAMLESGDRLPRFETSSTLPRVDKHSSGGLGDKISLILAPLLAAANVHVPMISGRGLGLTGGTLDKLESIPGFRVDWDAHETLALLRQAGCCIVAASEQIAPADRRLYRLRDVTATVESVALITASILSKKLAASLDGLVMDVKVGSAAFMKTEDDARLLAQSLVDTGKAAGLPVSALLTDMDQPLGRAVGNAIEVNESLDVLQGNGPKEVRELTLQLAAKALVIVGAEKDLTTARNQLTRLLDSGSAMERFEKMVAAQGGILTGHLSLSQRTPILAPSAGYVESLDSHVLGECVVRIGGGRRTMNDAIDHAVGLDVQVRIGDRVELNQPLAFLHAGQEMPVDERKHECQLLADAFKISEQSVAARPLVMADL